MTSDGGQRAKPRRKRALWPVRKLRPGGERWHDLTSFTTAEERLDLIWPLTVEAWSLMGRAIVGDPREPALVRVSGPPPGPRTRALN